MTGLVYFINPVGHAGPIKIGHSTFPPARLASFQTWSPVALEISAQSPAEMSIERALHDRFSHARMHGEWFKPDGELVTLIGRLRAGENLLDLVKPNEPSFPSVKRAVVTSPNAKMVGFFKIRVERARQHASGVRGRVVELPSEVRRILTSAGGYRQEYRELTSGEVVTLEAFIRRCRSNGLTTERAA